MTTIDLLTSADASELLDFLSDYAKHDSKFDNAVQVRFGAPDFDHEVDKITEMIDDALTGNGGDYRRGSWGHIYVDTSEICEEIRARAEQGHIRLAFTESEMLYRKLLELFEYQEECEINDEAGDCIDKMTEVAKMATAADDQEYIFEHCLELCELDIAQNYGENYETRFLKIALRFITPANRAKFEAELSKHDSGWYSDDFKIIRLDMIRRLDGKSAAEAYIAANLESTALREIAYNSAMTRSDYTEAERLCVAAPDELRGYRISPWWYKLLEVYEQTGNLSKQAEVCERILLKGDMQYYDQLKSLLTSLGRWEAEYQTLLTKGEEQLSYINFMAILHKENEFNRLMAQVHLHEEMVFTYGKYLSDIFSDEVRELFISQISAQSAKAGNRKEYATLCRRIAVFANSGYPAQANALIDEYKLTYGHRPAFVDELTELGAF
jgi:hypothetical protein